jgi:tRNA threonylcarbamoyladenosine biosynthesis protein TsaB
MILCIETSALNCSVALYSETGLIDVLEAYDARYTHAEKLHVLIESLLKKNLLEPSSLLAVSVSSGPGSYTGLRIGVTAAKGLCYALSIPLISVSTLEALQYHISQQYKHSVYIPMIDARRREVYMQVFDEHSVAKTAVEARVIDEAYLQSSAPDTVIFGDGAEKFSDIKPAHVHIIEGIFPSAPMIGALAWEKFKSCSFEDVAYFEPFYLKDFVAGTPKKSVLD